MYTYPYSRYEYAIGCIRNERTSWEANKKKKKKTTTTTTTSKQRNIFNKILKGSLLSFSGFVFLCLLFNLMFVIRLRLRVFFFVYSKGMFTLVIFTLYTFAFFPVCCLVFINLYLPTTTIHTCRSSGLRYCNEYANGLLYVPTFCFIASRSSNSLSSDFPCSLSPLLHFH